MVTRYLKGRQNGGAKVILISLKFVISSISDNPTLFWTSIKIAELYNLYSPMCHCKVIDSDYLHHLCVKYVGCVTSFIFEA